MALRFEIDTPKLTEQSSEEAKIISDNTKVKQLLKSWFVGKSWTKINAAGLQCKALRNCTKDLAVVCSLTNELVREELVILNEFDEFNVDV
ncbi:MAG: hypothetical protein ICV85_09605 [Tolypothrix sp. T3-bin4]|nr:hypothetical protein [Tolypothrix sp. T3-bin4]